METILGIDLGTTNSAVSIIRDSMAVALRDDEGQAILPSAVGLDADGRLLVGQSARNQAVLAPERTILSIKRKMGQDVRVSMGDQTFTPQEISAIILRTLKERAAQRLGRTVTKAVITVPAFFSENQRAATCEAGELAGLDVVRIINEPTAASLTYDADQDRRERLLVYDLGGGTFDVSIVQVERGVVEVLASHGDTHLGGDDFDQLLLDEVCRRFQDEHDIDLRTFPAARSRLLQAVEQAKMVLSFEAYTTIRQAFIAEKDGVPLHLETTIDRSDYEQMIEPLLAKTVESVDAALADANLNAKDIDKVILVGGSTRTPMIHRLLEEQLGQSPHQEVDPDLCVTLGAAIQGGMIAGIDVGPVLVDITARTLGIRTIGPVDGFPTNRYFSPIIARNTPLPATRSNLYYTLYPGQEKVQIDVYQGEHDDTHFNEPVGSFDLDGLNDQADANSEILVRFDLSLDGTLKVTAVERATSHENQLTIDNAITRFRTGSREEAKARLAEMFSADATQAPTAPTEEEMDDVPEEIRRRIELGQKIVQKARRIANQATAEDAEEIRQLADELQAAVARQALDQIDHIHKKLDDILFYLEDTRS